MERALIPSLETPTLTKAELADLLFERLGLNKRESKDMVEAFFELVHMNRLKNRGLPVRPFDQTQTNMVYASQLLFDLLRNRNLEAYPADDLRRHLQMAVAETSSRGFRIVRGKVSKRHHVDGAVSLAMAAYDAVSNGGVDISVPIRLDSPFSDMSNLKPVDQQYLPHALQD